MRRRVGIARAMVTEPPLVLYDSPTAGLDPITANTIINLIIKERDLRNTAAIMVTHRYQDGHLMANFRYNPNSGQIERVSPARTEETHVKTKFFVMNEGRLVFEGSQAELKASDDPYVQQVRQITMPHQNKAKWAQLRVGMHGDRRAGDSGRIWCFCCPARMDCSEANPTSTPICMDSSAASPRARRCG